MSAADKPADSGAVAATRTDERHAAGVACGAHALHDGLTDVIFVLLPVWQREFGLGYAEVGLLRGLYAGTMATFQIPAALLAERTGAPLMLAFGTALACIGYVLVGASHGFPFLVAALVIGGLGASVQHPLASSLMARAFAGARSLKALGTYNFFGDVGKMTIPAAAALMLTVTSWQTAVTVLGFSALLAAVVIFVLTPRYGAESAASVDMSSATAAATSSPDAASLDAAGRSTVNRIAFPVLLSIGVIDSAVRMAFLTFLPFLLSTKGASLPIIGIALTLVFAGGAVGKLVCAFIGARIGAIATVCLTEGLTAVAILALLPLPLEGAMLLLPLIGVALNGTSSVLYGSVPDLVVPARRTRAFSIFYTGSIGAGALAPALFGIVGDSMGISAALIVVALIVLLTLPLALILKPMVPSHLA